MITAFLVRIFLISALLLLSEASALSNGLFELAWVQQGCQLPTATPNRTVLPRRLALQPRRSFAVPLAWTASNNNVSPTNDPPVLAMKLFVASGCFSVTNSSSNSTDAQQRLQCCSQDQNCDDNGGGNVSSSYCNVTLSGGGGGGSSRVTASLTASSTSSSTCLQQAAATLDAVVALPTSSSSSWQFSPDRELDIVQLITVMSLNSSGSSTLPLLQSPERIVLVAAKENNHTMDAVTYRGLRGHPPMLNQSVAVHAALVHVQDVPSPTSDIISLQSSLYNPFDWNLTAEEEEGVVVTRKGVRCRTVDPVSYTVEALPPNTSWTRSEAGYCGTFASMSAIQAACDDLVSCVGFTTKLTVAGSASSTWAVHNCTMPPLSEEEEEPLCLLFATAAAAAATTVVDAYGGPARMLYRKAPLRATLLHACE